MPEPELLSMGSTVSTAAAPIAPAPASLAPVIAPSMLSSDFAELGRDANHMLACGADWLHMDVMDGHFVPNMTIGAPVIKSLRGHTKAFLDMHMMVSKPEQWVSDFAKAGADSYTFHYEATAEPLELIKLIRKSGMKVGVAIKPKTDWQKVVDLAPLVDMILVMTVEPGFGGQKFMSDMMPKVTALRAQFPTLNIQVDGGVDANTVHTCAAAGANVIVSGSGVFLSKDGPKHAISAMRQTVQSQIDKSKAGGSAAAGGAETSESAARDVKSDGSGGSAAAAATAINSAAAALDAERDRIWNRTPSDTDGSLQRLYRTLWSGSRWVGSTPKNSINL